jgi:phosphatidylinositol-3-phosphatase
MTQPRGGAIGIVGCVAALVLALSACGADDKPSSADQPRETPTATPSRTTTPTVSASPSTRPTPVASHSASPSTTKRPDRPQKVLVVIEENHSYAQMKQGMPYLARLSSTYGYATHWTALTHPSLPNYLGIAGGSTFGVTDDGPPSAHDSDIGAATSVFDQAIAAGRTAGTYAESMPDNCHLANTPASAATGPYAVRHNPWAYFPRSRDDCRAHDQDLSSFAGDAARNALPDVGFLIPDLDHDAHDGTLAAADAWLEKQLSPVLASTDFTDGRLVVVVTADEDDKHSGNTVLTSVLTPRIHHEVVHTPLTHYSLTRFIAAVLGVRPLRNGATAPDLEKAFHF